MMSNLKRPAGRYVIAERPGVLFTAGTRGEGNDDILSNDVDWVGRWESTRQNRVARLC